ncbi:MAG: phosphopantetheine-binding protein [Myxococcales bacterium]|nr:phosphopantetheine-binding protein [Myxococcales bacterium]MDD9967956.1 phosphopantetheine-binding protein [Myxococcales bacterium]
MAENIAVPIREFVTRSFSGQQLADEDDMFALGFATSLFAMQLVAFVEKQFGVEVDSDDLDIDNFRSVRAIAGLVERKLAA